MLWTAEDCAIRLSNENDKWLRFNTYNRKERVSFVVYANLECILEKTDSDPRASQHHRVLSLYSSYYIHCFYDESLCYYRFHRDEDCVAWFVEELRNLTHL